MATQTPFEIIVQHYSRNVLLRCVRFLDENMQMRDSRGRMLDEGSDVENDHYSGLLMVFDGPVLLEKASRMFLRQKSVREELCMRSGDDLLEYLGQREKTGESDSVYLFNTEASCLTRIKGELRNDYPGLNLDDMIEKSLPSNFLTKDGRIPVNEIGTKTAIALIVPQIDEYHGVRTIILKRTPYNLGMGKIAQFDRYGLEMEFFFVHNPNIEGPFIDREHSITGIYRNYRDMRGMPVMERNGILVPSRQLVVDAELKDKYRNSAVLQRSAGEEEHHTEEHAIQSAHP